MKKILIIEDEQILGEIINKKLSSEGYSVTLAVDGQQGVDMAMKIVPDLILLDLMMPKMNGFEVIETLKNYDVTKSIPIIVISNSGQQTEIERVVDIGVKDYIIKAQFSPDDVIEKVKKYLNEEYSEGKGDKKINDNKNIKILLAEDDQFLSSLVAQRLSKEGYKVISATDGGGVLKIFEENTPDLVLMDIIMPEMNGMEILKNIKSQDKYKNTIVIIFSNLGQDHEIEEAMKAGADDFLVKVNFTLKEVVEKIQSHLKKKGKV